MALELYVNAGGRKLRCGYTTGTCAALAAAAAARLLLTGTAPERVSLRTPKGVVVEVSVEGARLSESGAECTVTKDGGDDADATHGLPITARLERTAGSDITLQGGEGVGRVTRPGLDQPVGGWAINRVPRAMILQAVEEVRESLDEPGGLQVTISVPGGARAAARTFNPHLGIEGGISILGTSGIVEPMSVQAITDTVALELRQAWAEGARRLALIPGNYARDFLSAHPLPSDVRVVCCSNFLGEALDEAGGLGFREVLLVGHLGKLVKVAGGVMNTHSRWADCRMELLCAHALLAGAAAETARALLSCPTTDAALALLPPGGLREKTMASLLSAMEEHLCRRLPEAKVGAMVFSNQYGLLGVSPGGEALRKEWNG